MPTPSKQQQRRAHRTDSGNWGVASREARRSVFGNYRQTDRPSGEDIPSPPLEERDRERRPYVSENPSSNTVHGNLQAAIDTSIARSFLYQFLARAFDDSTPESWTWLTDPETHSAVRAASRTLSASAPNLEPLSVTVACAFHRDQLEEFQIAFVTAFGHAARGDCPLNEIEFGDLKTDPLFQPHRLADLAAFYRAFGMQVAVAAAERPDHIGMELEFMSVLTAREAYAREHQLDQAQFQICLDAQKKFLRDHLGRWAPAFSRRLARSAVHPALAAIAELTGSFIAAESARFNLPAGSEDLLLRPVDESTESLCASCGLAAQLPGAPTR
jgi:DMSO reductase family type II enzyme chaperone